MDYTKKTLDKNFIEWHNGVESYGLWCFIIESQEWLSIIQRYQQRLQKYLIEGYHRIPHITISTVGLMKPSQWNQLEKQLTMLQSSCFTAPEIEIKNFDSYAHNPILRVSFQDSELKQLRKALAEIAMDNDDKEPFDPHITLGHYNDKIPFASLFKSVSDISVTSCSSLKIHSLSFCIYQTHSINSELSIIHTVDIVNY